MEGFKFYFEDETTYTLDISQMTGLRVNSCSDMYGHRLEIFLQCPNTTPFTLQLRPLYDNNVKNKVVTKVEWVVGESVLDEISGETVNVVCTLSKEWLGGVSNNTYTEVINVSKE